MKRIVPGLSLLLIVSLFALNVWLFKGFTVDDVFITFRYVQQWTHGHGLVFNMGERVEGYSNFLWLVLLAPFDLLKIDLMAASKCLGLAFSLGTLGLTYKLCRAFLAHPTAALWLAASGPFAAWACSGLETALFTFLLTASAYTFVRPNRKTGWLSGTLFGLLCLTRPEGALFALVAIGYRAASLWRGRTSAGRRDWQSLASLAAIVIPDFCWRYAYYGNILPNTVYAKSMGLHPRSILEGAYYIYKSFAVLGGAFFVAWPLALALTARPRLPWVDYLALNVAAYAAFVLAGGGDWMPMLRFVVHILPLVYLLAQAGLEQFIKTSPERWANAIGLILVLGQVGYLQAGVLDQRLIQGAGAGPWLPNDSATVAFLRQQVRPTDTIAVVDAGFNVYRLPLETRAIDIVGLTDAHIAHRPVQLPGGLWGRNDAFGKWDTDYVLGQKPRWVQVNLVGSSENGKWETNFTGATLLVNDPRFQALYDLVDEPGVAGIFVRKDLP